MSVRDMSIEELLAEAVGTAPKRTPASPETSAPTTTTSAMAGIHPTEDHDLEGALVTAVTEAIRRVLRERRGR